MKLDFPHRLAALCCACSFLLVGCAAEPVVQPADRSSRLDRSLYQAAESFEKRRDYTTAVSYYRNLYRRDQKDVDAVVGLSRGLRHLQQAREAQSIVLRAIKEAPKDQHLRAELGKIQLALGEPLKAIDSLSRVDAEIQGKRWDIKIAMAIAYDRLGMYEQAERRYHQALELSPENAIVMNNYALSLAQAGRLTEAVGILERAAAMPEATPRMRQNLALLYAMQGDLTLAEQYVRRDMPPNIADQNMAYYRQLRAGIAVGDKAPPPPIGRSTATAPATSQAPSRALLPAEVVAAAPAPQEKPASAKIVASDPAPVEKPAVPAATPTMTKATATVPMTTQQEAVQPKLAAAEKTVMTAPQEKPAPAEVAASGPAPAGKPAVPAAPPAMTTTVASPPIAAQQEAMPALTAPEPTEPTAPLAASAPKPDEDPKAAVPLVKAIPADEAAAPNQTTNSIPKPPAMNVATASAANVSPSLETKVPDAGAKAPETVVASVAVKGYRLQLGSFRSLDGAETLRARLLKEHHDLLLDVELVVETVTVPERGDFFRVNSRPVPNREMVDETCLRLAIRDVPCLLVSVP